MIFKIAKTELKTLFYSPIAWLIIIIFTFQTALAFTGAFGDKVHQQANGMYIYRATFTTFGGRAGLFTMVQQYLYLYIPLLTMGIYSREYSSGSIKLLFSSPISSTQIVLGKYLALLLFSLVLMGVLAIYCVFTIPLIQDVEVGLILSGLLGMFLLMAAYAAIGSFMSSLTSYAVVSAMGTLAIFALLSYIKGIGQDVEFVRDITYWMAISGRTDTFILGMITSEDVAYFLIVAALFVFFTLIKLNSERKSISRLKLWGQYLGGLLVVCVLGYCTALPKFKTYFDVTQTKANTLTKSSQEVLNKLDGDLTITTYVNMLEDNYMWALPAQFKFDVSRFDNYVRFKPEIKMKYVYYYHPVENSSVLDRFPGIAPKKVIDSIARINKYTFPILTAEELEGEANLADEDYRFVRKLSRSNGASSYLRIFDDMQKYPSEAEISAAFKRLVIDDLPTVGFVVGHKERGSSSEMDRGYNTFAQEKTFRYSLVNQGFDFEDVNLIKPVPENIRILLLAEPREALSDSELAHLYEYVNNGGNMLIAGEPGGQDYLNPILQRLGVELLPGMLVKPNEKFSPDFMMMKPTKVGEDFSYHMKSIVRNKLVLPFDGAAGLSILDSSLFKIQTLFVSDSVGGWNELVTTNFLDDSVQFDADHGELMRSFPTVLSLSRRVGEKDQKIIVTGDADWLSNKELSMSRKDMPAANFNFFNASFYWLSGEELPIDMRRPPFKDNAVKLSQSTWGVFKIMFNWGFVALLIAGSGILLLRRKGR